MHWTALLARQRFPGNARVIGDVPCIGCQYNLRGLRASGKCPECGEAVADALYLLREPETVGSALGTLAYSYLTFAAPLLILSGSLGLLWLAVGIVLLGGATRIVAAAELWRGGGIERLPLVGTQTRRLLWMSVLETVVGALAIAGLVWSLGPAPPPATGLAGFAALLWPVVVLVASVQASRVGGMLAEILDYDFIATELRVHRILMVAGLALGGLFGLPGVIIGGRGGQSMLLAGLGLAGVTIAIATGFLIVGLLHTAGAAQRTTTAREDVLEEQGA